MSVLTESFHSEIHSLVPLSEFERKLFGMFDGYYSSWVHHPIQSGHDVEIGRTETRSLGAVMNGSALLATSQEIPNATSPARSP